MTKHQANLTDQLIGCADNALRTLFAKPQSARPSPADSVADGDLTPDEKQHSIRLMRVNHTGEVCAQALYQGQALTAKLPKVRNEMEQAAKEEIDHLAWCQQRIDALGGSTSILNPGFYAASFAIGAGAGLISDRMSLGFVAATEDQVCSHLQRHLGDLPDNDEQSRAIVTQMHSDEDAHRKAALDAGGHQFPEPVRKTMTLLSRVMTESVSRI